MKNTLKLVLISALFIAAFFYGNPLHAQDQYMNEVRGYYDKMKEMSVSCFKSGKTTYMDYAINLIPLDKQNKAQYSEVKAWINCKDSKIENDKVSVYKNEKESFMVLPEQHLIIIADAPPIPNEDPKKNAFWMKLQDTLFMMSSVKGCTVYKNKNGEWMKKIVLVLNAKGEKIFGIGSITFDISVAAKQIREMNIRYAGDEGKMYGQVAFTTMDVMINDMKVIDESTPIFAKDIEKMFFKEGTELRSAYAGYKLVDKRVKSKKSNKNI